MREQGQPRRKRRLIRTRVSPAEQAICLVLLALIPAAAGGVYLKGQRFDRGLYELDPALVKATARRANAPAGASADPGEDAAGALAALMAAGVPAGAGFAVPGVPPSADPGLPPALPGGPAATPAVPGTAAPATATSMTPTGAQGGLPASFGDPAWTLSGAVERFRPDNLYEKINGKADQYLRNGVAGLTAASYTDRRDAKRFLDVYLYDMGNSRNAFGIFSGERPAAAATAKLGDQGYRVEASYFFTRGRYYVQVLASDRGKLLEEAGLKLARTLDALLGSTSPAAPPPAAPPEPPTKTAVAAAPPKRLSPQPVTPAPAAKEPDFDSPQVMLGLFPTEDAIPQSGEYQRQDALNLSFLAETYTTRYRVGENEYTLFLTKREGVTPARELLAKYGGFLEQLGTIHQRGEEGELHFLIGEMGGFFDIVFQAGPFFGGVNGAPERATGEALGLRLLRSLVKSAPKLLPESARTLEQWPTPAAPVDE